MFRQSAIKIVSLLILFVVTCLLTGCRITRTMHPLSNPDAGEFLPDLIGSYKINGEDLNTGLAVLRKSKTKSHAYEFIDAKANQYDGLRLIKLGNWNFVEVACGGYYCVWRYTNDDGVITLYSVDDSRETDSRTTDFLRSLKIEGHNTTAEDLKRDFNSIWDLRDSPSPPHQPSAPALSNPDAHSTVKDSDMPQVIGEIPTPSAPAHSILKTPDLQKAFRKYGDTFNRVYGELRKIN